MWNLTTTKYYCNNERKSRERVRLIMIRFDKLWETAKSKGITKTALHKKHHISKSQLSRLRHNEVVNTCTIDRLCNLLECDVSDIMEHIPDDNFF